MLAHRRCQRNRGEGWGGWGGDGGDGPRSVVVFGGDFGYGLTGTISTSHVQYGAIKMLCCKHFMIRLIVT